MALEFFRLIAEDHRFLRNIEIKKTPDFVLLDLNLIYENKVLKFNSLGTIKTDLRVYKIQLRNS